MKFGYPDPFFFKFQCFGFFFGFCKGRKECIQHFKVVSRTGRHLWWVRISDLPNWMKNV